MIAFHNEQNETTWQSNFVAMLPEIEQKLRLAFCRLDPEAREDATEEGVVHSLLAYVRLSKAGSKLQPHHRLLGTVRDMSNEADQLAVA